MLDILAAVTVIIIHVLSARWHEEPHVLLLFSTKVGWPMHVPVTIPLHTVRAIRCIKLAHSCRATSLPGHQGQQSSSTHTAFHGVILSCLQGVRESGTMTKNGVHQR